MALKNCIVIILENKHKIYYTIIEINVIHRDIKVNKQRLFIFKKFNFKLKFIACKRTFE